MLLPVLHFFFKLGKYKCVVLSDPFLICPNLYMYVRTENSRDEQLVLWKSSHTQARKCVS